MSLVFQVITMLAIGRTRKFSVQKNEKNECLAKLAHIKILILLSALLSDKNFAERFKIETIYNFHKTNYTYLGYHSGYDFLSVGSMLPWLLGGIGIVLCLYFV